LLTILVANPDQDHTDELIDKAAEGARAPSAAQQRIRAECPPNSEMELESELEDALGEAARGDQLLV
jgi:hypothetical protein